MVMHMSRHQKGYGVRREGKMGGGGLEREQKKPLFLFPFYPFLPPPLSLPLFVPGMQVIDKVRCNGTIDV